MRGRFSLAALLRPRSSIYVPFFLSPLRLYILSYAKRHSKLLIDSCIFAYGVRFCVLEIMLLTYFVFTPKIE